MLISIEKLISTLRLVSTRRIQCSFTINFKGKSFTWFHLLFFYVLVKLTFELNQIIYLVNLKLLFNSVYLKSEERDFKLKIARKSSSSFWGLKSGEIRFVNTRLLVLHSQTLNKVCPFFSLNLWPNIRFVQMPR